MRLTIEKHGKGYTVRESGIADAYYETLCATTTLDEALAFIRSRMDPEGEGEKPLDKLQRLGQEADAAEPESGVWEIKRSAPWYDDGKPEPTPTDPPWKRAKVGDWVELNRFGKKSVKRIKEVRAASPSGEPHFWVEEGSWLLFVSANEVASILPNPPSHGGFGSMGQEDGA